MGDISELNRLASRQHGVFNRSQLHDAGFDRFAVHHRLATGVWMRVDDSVYALASAPATWRQRLWVATLSRRNAVLTHRTAIRLHGLGAGGEPRPVIMVPRGANVRSSVADVYESDQFDLIATTSVEGLTVTTMPETLLVLARDVRGPALTGLFDEALVSGKLDLTAMAATIDREAGRRTPGAPQLRELTSSRRPGAPSRTSSYLERRMELLLSDPRIPPWNREYEMNLSGAVSRVDFYIGSRDLVIEADGRNWHARWQDMERDRMRDNALAARGIQVLRYLYDTVRRDPRHCLDEIVSVCRVRAA